MNAEEHRNAQLARAIDSGLRSRVRAGEPEGGVEAAEVEFFAQAVNELRGAYADIEAPFRFEPGGALAADSRRDRLRSVGLVALPLAAAALIALTLSLPHMADSLPTDRTNVGGDAGPSALSVSPPVAHGPIADGGHRSATDRSGLRDVRVPRLHVRSSQSRIGADAGDVGADVPGIGGRAARLTSYASPRFSTRSGASPKWMRTTNVPSFLLRKRSPTDEHETNDRSDHREPVGRSDGNDARHG